MIGIENNMRFLILPAVTTIIFTLCTKPNSLLRPMIFFLVMMTLSYLFSSNCHASQIHIEQFTDNDKPLQDYRCFPDKPLNDGEMERMKMLMNIHWSDFLGNMDELQYHSLFIPLEIDREKVIEESIKCAVACAMSGSITASALIVIGDLLTNYLLNVYDEYTEMKICFNSAKYHLDCYFFYKGVLDKNRELHGDFSLYR